MNRLLVVLAPKPIFPFCTTCLLPAALVKGLLPTGECIVILLGFEPIPLSERIEPSIVLKRLDSPVLCKRDEPSITIERLDSPVLCKRDEPSIPIKRLDSPALCKRDELSIPFIRLELAALCNRFDESKFLDEPICADKSSIGCEISRGISGGTKGTSNIAPR